MSELNPFELTGNTVEIDGEERKIEGVELGKLSEPGQTVKFEDGGTMEQEKLEEKLENDEAKVLA